METTPRKPRITVEFEEEYSTKHSLTTHACTPEQLLIAGEKLTLLAKQAMVTQAAGAMSQESRGRPVVVPVHEIPSWRG